MRTLFGFMFGMLFFSGLAPMSSAGDEWMFQTIGDQARPARMTDHAMRVGYSGHSRMACGGDRLYFTRRIGFSTSFDVVDDSPGVGAYASLWETENFKGHISYYDSVNGALKYAAEVDSEWEIETVDSNGNAGTYSAITLDGSGSVTIAYRAGGELRIARKISGQWQIETLCSDAVSGCSMDVDPSGLVHLCFTDAAAGLIHAVKTGACWYLETVDPAAGSDPSLVMDSAGNPHISYCQSGDVYHATNDGEWQIELALEGEWRETSIAVDPAGLPWIVFRSNGTNDNSIRCIRHDGDVWVAEWTDPDVGSDGGYPSVVINDDGEPGIFYLCADDRRHHPCCAFVYNGGTGDHWLMKPVPVQSSIGRYFSLALDRQDRFHLAYCDREAVKYRWYDGIAWREDGFDLSSTPEGSSLVLNSDDGPHILFCDMQGVNLALKSGESWCVELIYLEPIARIFGETLAFDSAGQPHACYLTFSFSGMGTGYYDIVHAWKNGASWTFEVIDTFFTFMSLNADISMAFDHDDALHITSHDYGSDRFMHYHKNGTGWQSEIVEMGTHAGRYNSIKITSGNVPVIGYTGYGCVKFARKPGSEWLRETVEGIGDGFCTSLDMALDDRDRPHIAYYTHPPIPSGKKGMLKHAVSDDSAWQVKAVIQDFYYYDCDLTLVVNRDGDPHIVFPDRNANELKIASKNTEPAPTPTPTPPPSVGVTLWMPAHYFSPGDLCGLTAHLRNDGDPLIDIHLFIMLQIGTEFWFWPSWDHLLPDDSMDVPTGGMDVEVIPEFSWPDLNGASMDGLMFWGGMVDSSLTEILGGSEGISNWEFGFGP